MNRSACVFTRSVKIAVSLEITAIRCKLRTPEISLWSLNNGDRCSAIELSEYFGENNSDLRTVRTEKALYDAFRELAAERPLKEITVKALTDRAEINRKTFYIHYHDIEGFIAGLQQRFISEVAIYMGNVLEERNAETAFRKTLCYLAADPEWYHLILSTSDYGQIWAVLEDPDTRPWDFESFLPETAHAPEIVRYLMGAIRNIFCIWYESGMKMSAEEMAEFGTRLALHGIYSPDN